MFASGWCRLVLDTLKNSLVKIVAHEMNVLRCRQRSHLLQELVSIQPLLFRVFKQNSLWLEVEDSFVVILGCYIVNF